MDKQTNLAKIFEFVLKFKTGKIILRIFGALIVPEVRVNVHVGGRTGWRKVAVE